MPLNLKTASGGSVIITGANTASDKTITVPAADGNMLYADSSGNAQINSGYGSLATGYVARAWVNFNGTGTVAIRASGNVSSITDNGVGSYIVNFTTSMPDTNYSVVKSDNFYSLGDVKTFNTNNVTVQCYQAIGSSVDTSIVCVAIFR